MTNEEINILIKSMKERTERIKINKEESRDFLISAGILDKNGKLSKHYKNKN